MSYKVTLTQKQCFNMDPLELADMLEKEMRFNIPDEVIGRENQKMASETVTKATAYASYFTEMEMKARILKKTAKAAKKTDEYNRMMAIEDVFKSFKEIAKMQIENVAKLMTLKRLELEDQKNNYNSNIT